MNDQNNPAPGFTSDLEISVCIRAVYLSIHDWHIDTVKSSIFNAFLNTENYEKQNMLIVLNFYQKLHIYLRNASRKLSNYFILEK